MIVLTGRDGMATSHPALLHVRVLVRTRHLFAWQARFEGGKTGKGRFEAREGWSEAEPFLCHGGM